MEDIGGDFRPDVAGYDVRARTRAVTTFFGLLLGCGLLIAVGFFFLPGIAILGSTFALLLGLAVWASFFARRVWLVSVTVESLALVIGSRRVPASEIVGCQRIVDVFGRGRLRVRTVGGTFELVPKTAGTSDLAEMASLVEAMQRRWVARRGRVPPELRALEARRSAETTAPRSRQ